METFLGFLLLKSYFCNQIEGEMNFGIARFSQALDDLWCLFDKWTKHGHKCSLNEEHYFEMKFILQWWLELQASSESSWDQLFCLEASTHFKICTCRQIIVNLKAKDYSLEKCISSENRVVSLWFPSEELKQEEKLNSDFYFLEEGTVLLLTGLCYQM